MSSPLRADAESIFRAALDRVDPVRMVRQVLRRRGDRLEVAPELGGTTFDLSAFDRVVVTGMGKASARMALGLEEVLGDCITDGWLW